MIRTKHLVIGFGFLSVLLLSSFFFLGEQQVTLVSLPEKIIFNTPRDEYGVGGGSKEEVSFDRERFIASVRSALGGEQKITPKKKEPEPVVEETPVTPTEMPTAVNAFRVQVVTEEGSFTTATATISVASTSAQTVSATGTIEE
jgi:hypothetical protein